MSMRWAADWYRADINPTILALGLVDKNVNKIHKNTNMVTNAKQTVTHLHRGEPNFRHENIHGLLQYSMRF